MTQAEYAGPRLRAMMTQSWRDVAFVHWPVPVEQYAARIPQGLELDTHQGRAWVSVVALSIAQIRLPILGRIPIMPAFPELNLRTYVRRGTRRGVYFFRIEATNRLAVATARMLFHAPYHRVPMTMTVGAPTNITTNVAAPTIARYTSTMQPIDVTTDPLAAFLTARTCMFCDYSNGSKILRCDIEHGPWDLRGAAVDIEAHSLFAGAGLQQPDTEPIAYWARETATRIAWPRRG